ncbi:MAG: tRNA (adenosine(37)-N6)-threonylcarbamoyltransferase complex transferase subunit TsaD [Candidatus Moranbacteria bacterium]|nr:tRNA (adenosine(37)-N6)-threonylcarbamoyltransferase complex transferase subunit TsaD [Candidatus Moranbacteria bacterium]
MNSEKSLKILAIETSCDDTAAAIVTIEDGVPTVLSSVVSSQIELHRQYGGVVPALAAREHVKNLVPVIDEAMRMADAGPSDLDAIAVTRGPGLIPALLAGVSGAKALALAWQKPLLGIHHIEGHIYANFISQKSIKSEIGSPESDIGNWKLEIGNSCFPLLALVVSGGHTELVLMRDHFEYEILGRTRDDAAGEAFDKVAKMLDLPYPGGPEVAKHASKFKDAERSRFPRPMIDSGDYDFSFSGLKTAVLYEIRKTPETDRDETFVSEICHAFQEAVVDVLVTKTKRAIEEFAPKTLVIAGGVSANTSLRESLSTMAAEFPYTEFTVPELQYSLDNAAMIGSAAILRFAHLSTKERDTFKQNAIDLEPDANLPLGDK